MGFLGRDPWTAGVRTTASVERVYVTRWESDGRTITQWVYDVYLAFGFTDQTGQRVVQEKKWQITRIPAPGMLAEIAYLPDKPDHFDYDIDSFRPRDPTVAAGWGAGIFEVPDIGTHRPEAQDPGLAQERELFRSGRRVFARVVRIEHDSAERHGAYGHQLTLEAEGERYVVNMRMPLGCAPPEGAGIKMAIGEYGDVALDTDERYYGPPGRALVFTQPPPNYQPRTVDPEQARADMAEQTARAMTGTAAEHRDLILAQVQRMEAMRDAGQMTEEVFQATRSGLLARIPASGGVPTVDVDDRIARLERARDAGRISAKQFEQMRAALDHKR